MEIDRFGVLALEPGNLPFDALFETGAAEILKPAAAADKAPRREEAAALRLEAIALSFGGVMALAGLDLCVRKGDIHAIIGPNGAGKSSVLNVISGIYRPDRGSVAIASKRFAHVPTQRLAQLGIARTFQNLALFKRLSVLDNIVTGCVASTRAGFAGQMIGVRSARREESEGKERAQAVIEFLDLGSVRDREAGTLPYGIQKRVELGRALVAKPEILLLDEPMAGMTANEKREMSDFVRAARDEY